jgi:hypothetical protein
LAAVKSSHGMPQHSFTKFELLQEELKTTAVFGRRADQAHRTTPAPKLQHLVLWLPKGGATPLLAPSLTFMAKNLTKKTFSNFTV